MLRVGLTGGIACGKSVVAAIMRELGCHVLSADPLAHQMIEPGQPSYDAVVHEFGRAILDGDGRIIRAKLGEIVFADRTRLAKLNAIVHPPVLEELDRRLDQLASSDPHGVAVVEAALLIEASYHHRLDRLIVVACTSEQQLERLMRRGMNKEQAEQRIAAQLGLAEKRKLADDEIDCSGTLEETRRQVVKLVEKLKHLAAPSKV
jgi:dephospho-CoA kinase